MRVLLVDDERLARLEMLRLLQAHPEAEIVGEARNADEARAQIERLRPDVLFLDIQMPGRSGFELLEQLEFSPAVIFTTAFDEFALRAFEVSAVDYLVKPIVPARLAAAWAKLIERQRPAVPAAGAGASSGSLSGSSDRQIFVRDGERCWFVRLCDLDLLESEGNYTRLWFGAAQGAHRPLVPHSLNQLEARLDPARFFRASRKHIVNLQAIESLAPWVNGGLLAHIRGGQEVTISRRQALAFQARMRL